MARLTCCLLIPISRLAVGDPQAQRMIEREWPKSGQLFAGYTDCEKHVNGPTGKYF